MAQNKQTESREQRVYGRSWLTGYENTYKKVNENEYQRAKFKAKQINHLFRKEKPIEKTRKQTNKN